MPTKEDKEMARPTDFTDMTKESAYSLRYQSGTAIYWSLYGLVKYIPSPIGWFLRFAVLKLFCKKIESYKIDEGVQPFFAENISIGKNVRLQTGALFGGIGELILEDWSGLGAGAMVASEDHSFRKGKYLSLQPKLGARTVIKRDAWIGAGAVVTKGVTIGQGAIVGPNSVVTRDVPPNAYVIGSPAKIVAYRSPHTSKLAPLAGMSREEQEVLSREASDIDAF